MRIRQIKIESWRHFSNIELDVADDTGLVCLVGANGTGKSHLLELIAACAHRLGLSQGIEIPRGDPFGDPHKFSLRFYFAVGVSDAIDPGLHTNPNFTLWDRTLTINSESTPEGHSISIRSGGIAEISDSEEFARQVVSCIQKSKSVHFLSLDADRAYPKKNVNFNEVAQAYEVDWEGDEYTRGRSFRTTTMLYDEWLKYFLAQENQAGTRLIQEIRRARESNRDEPKFSDHFLRYKEALQQVLPHIVFSGVNSKNRTLQFDTTGLQLTFDKLSGGEREIAFLVGQIDRFGLRQGLFLLDEPELHLNSDLIRSWVAYLTSTVDSGQIWLATHALEAVEAAGQHATFIIERNEDTRKVESVARLDTRPVVSALSRAVGTPAFSLTQLRFVYVEGEETLGERERFRRLAGSPDRFRFMETGSCSEVLRRVGTIRALSGETEGSIRIGGIVDRDFLSESAIADLCGGGLHVLDVHEVENFFIHPPMLNLLLTQNGLTDTDPNELIMQVSDARAGSWAFQYAMSTPNAKSLPEIPRAAKEVAKSVSWDEISSERDTKLQQIVDLSGYEDPHASKLRRLLSVGFRRYERKRVQTDLWKACEGKQVLNEVARRCGFSGAPSLVLAAFAAWENGQVIIPPELQRFRDYLARL